MPENRLNFPAIRSTTLFGIALSADAIYVPLPSRHDRVEREQPLFGQRGEELDREERIAPGLLVHQLRERPRMLELAVQSIGDNPSDMAEPRGARTISCTLVSASRIASIVRRSGCAGPTSLSSIGPRSEAGDARRSASPVLEEVERRCIKPLQIVEEQRERVLLPCEYAEETPENHLKSVLRFLRRQVRDRWLFSNHKLQRGNEVDDS